MVVVDADRRKLDGMSRTHSHQGVIAVAAAREYASVDDILNIAREKGEAPLIVVCDELSDPHNLGAVIRTADAAGAHGVIIPKRRSAGLTAVVAKTSAGAVAHVPVARVPNITALLKQLKDEGVWVFGTAAQGNTSLYKADLKGPAAIVIGSEGDGMSRLVAENCDFTVSIPMFGKINSLNVKIPDWVPVIGGNTFRFNIPQIPQLATGGIVTAPTLLEAGEGGEPEAIIPLSKLYDFLLNLGKPDPTKPQPQPTAGGQNPPPENKPQPQPAEGGGGGFVFSPTIILKSNGSVTRKEVDQAMDFTYQKFVRFSKQLEEERRRKSFSPA